MNRFYFGILAIALSLSGCAYTSSIKSGMDVYNQPVNANSPRIAIVDLKDRRQNPNHVGQVSALAINQPSTPINMILTNRIASKLVDQGFNVQKIHALDLSDQSQTSEMIMSSGAVVLITGDLHDFFIKSFDAMMEPAKGRGEFTITVLDASGEVIYKKLCVGTAEHFIGLTGQFGADKAIDKTIDAGVGQLFEDPQFKEILQKLK